MRDQVFAEHPELIDAYDKIIRKTVFDYIRGRGLAAVMADDLIQECWVALLKVMDKKGDNFDYFEYPMIKTIVYKKLRSAARKDQGQIRRQGTLVGDQVDTGYMGDLEDKEDNSPFDITTTSKYNREQFDLYWNMLMDQFPEGSNERKYLEWYGQKADLYDYGITPNDSREKDGYTDSNLAISLGFKSGTSDRRWKALKQKMQAIIRDYFKDVK